MSAEEDVANYLFDVESADDVDALDEPSEYLARNAERAATTLGASRHLPLPQLLSVLASPSDALFETRGLLSSNPQPLALLPGTHVPFNDRWIALCGSTPENSIDRLIAALKRTPDRLAFLDIDAILDLLNASTLDMNVMTKAVILLADEDLERLLDVIERLPLSRNQREQLAAAIDRPRYHLPEHVHAYDHSRS